MMYSNERIMRAIEVFRRTRNFKETIAELGYPDIFTLRHWVRRSSRTFFRYDYDPNDPLDNFAWLKRRFTDELRFTIAKRIVENGESIQDVAQETGYSTVSIRTWVKKYKEAQVSSRTPPKQE